jgi:hypothetical protein
LYLNEHLFLEIWEIFCYFMYYNYIMYTFGLHIFFANTHDLQVWSFGRLMEFLCILFAYLESFVKESFNYFVVSVCHKTLKFCVPFILVCWNGFKLYFLFEFLNKQKCLYFQQWRTGKQDRSFLRDWYQCTHICKWKNETW